jgi:hypothetical protein
MGLLLKERTLFIAMAGSHQIWTLTSTPGRSPSSRATGAKDRRRPPARGDPGPAERACERWPVLYWVDPSRVQ